MRDFLPTRTAALERLARFLPHAGAAYAARRNHDFGPGRHDNVSGLSPYIRHRLLTEAEVLRATLGRHSPQAAEKFVDEVFWRAYWKGWLEMRPGVWAAYRAGLAQARDRLAVESGLRVQWADACAGNTGIAGFDDWAQDLVQTGYLHNHARMWFASIWVFTLRLPWELGADFFLRHLLDGDAASNTLGWRWVAGLHTPGKTYLARADNIAQFTAGRFHPVGLARDAQALTHPANPARSALPEADQLDPSRPSAFILHEDDLSPGWLFDLGLRPVATALAHAVPGRSPLAVSPNVQRFTTGALDDAATRWADRLGAVTGPLTDAKALADWAVGTGAEQIVAPYAPTGPMAEVLADLARHTDLPLIRPRRPYDSAAWPHATHGFFRFRAAIPDLIRDVVMVR